MTTPWIFLIPLSPSQSTPPFFRTDARAHDGRAQDGGGVSGDCISAAEVISLDSMRNAMVANFEQEDLDVPAFLRKRGEVM